MELQLLPQDSSLLPLLDKIIYYNIPYNEILLGFDLDGTLTNLEGNPLKNRR